MMMRTALEQSMQKVSRLQAELSSKDEEIARLRSGLSPQAPPSTRREPGGQNPMSDMDILMAFYEAREPEHADAAWIAKVVRRYQKKAAKINVRAPEGTKPLLLPPPKPLLGESALRMCVSQGARMWTGRS